MRLLKLRQKQNASIYALLLGNFLEIFEFSLYGIYSKLFAEIFFSNMMFGMFYSFCIFASGFLARPIGAVIFGHIGDKYGRRNALISSIFLMSLATFGIGLIPLPSQASATAPIVLLLLRVIQGISCGGEYIGIAIYLFERFSSKPGIAGALAATSGMTGTLIAILLSYLIFAYVPSNWGWRVPFLVSLLLGLLIIYLRLNLDESKIFIKNREKNQIQKYPLKIALRNYFPEFFSTICVGGCNGVLTFTLVAYVSAFLSCYTGLAFEGVLGINFISVLFFIASCLLTGLIKDKLRLSPCFFLALIAIFTFFFSPLVYRWLLQGGIISAIVGESILGILAGAFSGLCNVFMCQLFPSNIRYSGIAFGYSLGVSILGGTAPAFCSLFIEWTGSPCSAGLYLCVGSCVGIVGCIIGHRIINSRANI